MRSNRSKYAILGMLNHAPMSGYDIRKRIEEDIAHFWNESYGQIYPILKQLADEGLANRKTQKQSGKPDRQVYTITTKGQQEFKQWLGQPVQHENPRNELLLKLFFATPNSADQTRRQIEEFRRYTEHNLDELLRSEQQAKREGAGKPSRNAVKLLTLRYGIKGAQNTLSWCDDVIRTIGKPRKKAKAAYQ